MVHNIFWLCFGSFLAKVASDFDDAEEDSDHRDFEEIYGFGLPWEKELFLSNSIDLEKGSVSIPKSEPTLVPIPPVNEQSCELKRKIMHMYIYRSHIKKAEIYEF